jgi:hypothetical protein
MYLLEFFFTSLGYYSLKNSFLVLKTLVIYIVYLLDAIRTISRGISLILEVREMPTFERNLL